MRATVPILVLVATLVGSVAGRAGECRPVDADRIGPSQASGMKVWVFEDRGGSRTLPEALPVGGGHDQSA